MRNRDRPCGSDRVSITVRVPLRVLFAAISKHLSQKRFLGDDTDDSSPSVSTPPTPSSISSPPRYQELIATPRETVTNESSSHQAPADNADSGGPPIWPKLLVDGSVDDVEIPCGSDGSADFSKCIEMRLEEEKAMKARKEKKWLVTQGEGEEVNEVDEDNEGVVSRGEGEEMGDEKVLSQDK